MSEHAFLQRRIKPSVVMTTSRPSTHHKNGNSTTKYAQKNERHPGTEMGDVHLLSLAS